jgi:hypothetical protein
MVDGRGQVAMVRNHVLQPAVDTIMSAIPYRSVHAAALQPGRLARWLEEAARQLPNEEECEALARLALALVRRQRPEAAGEGTPAEAPGKVTAQQWEQGAVQLRREVSGCGVIVTVTVTVSMYMNVQQWEQGALHAAARGERLWPAFSDRLSAIWQHAP